MPKLNTGFWLVGERRGRTEGHAMRRYVAVIINSRALCAISAAVMTRNDDGRLRPNYSNMLGNFSAGAISNLYYPSSDRGASLVLLNGLADTGGDAAANLVREFLLKRFTSHAPKGASAQP